MRITLVFYSWAVFRTNGTAFLSGFYVTSRPMITSVVMAVAVRFLLEHIKDDLPQGAWPNAASQVAVGALAGAAIYGVLLLLTERGLLKKLLRVAAPAPCAIGARGVECGHPAEGTNLPWHCSNI